LGEIRFERSALSSCIGHVLRNKGWICFMRNKRKEQTREEEEEIKRILLP
jgi:hypothetical protein